MISKNFNYFAPASVPEALVLLRKFGNDAKLLAGGHSLLPMMKMRFAEPVHLIDMQNIAELKGISVHDDVISISVMASENSILRHESLAELCPLLMEATKWIADPQVRNKGTIGGDIAHGILPMTNQQ